MSGECRPLLAGYENIDNLSTEPSNTADNGFFANSSSQPISSVTQDSRPANVDQNTHLSNNTRNTQNERRRGTTPNNEQSRPRRARQRRRRQLRVKPSPNSFPDDRDFECLVRRAEEAIELGIYPERIVQGSSGSYFVLDKDKNRIGVFKPKDEEPYGINNPKWSKWLQKTFCPCTFGRSCLLLNKGFLSEAGAYVVDAHLGLRVVPPTYVVRLAAPTFHYGRIERETARLRLNVAEHFPAFSGPISSRLGLPLKVGSFQTFVRGYQEAQELLQKIDNKEFAAPSFNMLLNQFQRMAILDYIIRNTDRNHTNWLIKVEAEPKQCANDSAEHMRTSTSISGVDTLEPSRVCGTTCGATPANTLNTGTGTGTGTSTGPGPGPGTGAASSSLANSNEENAEPPQSGSLFAAIEEPPGARGDLSQPQPPHVTASRSAAVGVTDTGPRSGRDSPDWQPQRVAEAEAADVAEGGELQTSVDEEDFCVVQHFKIWIAAIDNGLAFPYKHPDSWRTYPYHWAYLPFARIPFQEDVRQLILPKLEDLKFVDGLMDKLCHLFRENDKEYERGLFARQMATMRGQIANLIQALGARKSPAELAAMDEIYMYKSVPARPPRLQSRPSGPRVPTGCAECVSRKCNVCAPPPRRRRSRNKLSQSRCVCSCHRNSDPNASSGNLHGAATDSVDAAASASATTSAQVHPVSSGAATTSAPAVSTSTRSSAAASPVGSSSSPAVAGTTPTRFSRPPKLLASGPSGMLHWLPASDEPVVASAASGGATSPTTVLVHTWPPRVPETPSGGESLATSVVSHSSTETLFKQKPHSRKPWFNF